MSCPGKPPGAFSHLRNMRFICKRHVEGTCDVADCPFNHKIKELKIPHDTCKFEVCKMAQCEYFHGTREQWGKLCELRQSGAKTYNPLDYLEQKDPHEELEKNPGHMLGATSVGSLAAGSSSAQSLPMSGGSAAAAASGSQGILPPPLGGVIISPQKTVPAGNKTNNNSNTKHAHVSGQSFVPAGAAGQQQQQGKKGKHQQHQPQVPSPQQQQQQVFNPLLQQQPPQVFQLQTAAASSSPASYQALPLAQAPLQQIPLVTAAAAGTLGAAGSPIQNQQQPQHPQQQQQQVPNPRPSPEILHQHLPTTDGRMIKLWICPQCYTRNHDANKTCENCDAPAPWTCSYCNNQNWGTKKICRVCKQPKAPSPNEQSFSPVTSVNVLPTAQPLAHFTTTAASQGSTPASGTLVQLPMVTTPAVVTTNGANSSPTVQGWSPGQVGSTLTPQNTESIAGSSTGTLPGASTTFNARNTGSSLAPVPQLIGVQQPQPQPQPQQTTASRSPVSTTLVLGDDPAAAAATTSSSIAPIPAPPQINMWSFE